jgi:hypothetical protein
MIRVTAISYQTDEQMTILEIDDDSFGEIYPHMFSVDTYLTVEYIKAPKEKK